MNIAKFALCVLCIIIYTNDLIAQPPFKRGGGGPKIVGKIQGTVFDNESKESINFATVALRKIGDTTDLDGMITDSKGQFKLTEVKMGKYQISIAFIGYETKVITDIELTPRKPDANLGKIYLLTDQVILDQVEVVGQKAVVENKVDRIVYNAENDETLIGGDATDVLQNVPMLAVDNDGNVSLRGSENITILVNGKISGMFSSNVADALKMFPADQIKSVEVITSPGAKYDAEGSAGLINIITKTKRFEGYSINVNGTLGNRINRGSVNANVAKGRFGFNAAANAYYSWPLDAENTFSRSSTIASVIDNYDQNGLSERERLGFFGQAGAYYDFNAFNSINSSFNLRGFNSRNDGLLNIDILNAREDIQSLRDQMTDQGRTGFEWNTDYTKKFETEGQELSFAFQLNGSLENSTYEMRENAASELIAGENADNDGDNYQYTFQLDYVHPLGKGNKIELGAKSIIRDIESRFENFDIINPEFNIGDEFKYDQDVWSLYSQGSINLGNGFSSIIGLRYEHTDIQGNYLSGEPDAFDNDYDNLFPNFILSKSLGSNSIKFSYNRRIQRPSLRFINPYSNRVDRRNISLGNPFLDPEISDVFEIGYNAFKRGTVVTTSVYYRHTEDVIQPILEIGENNLGVTTFENVATNDVIGGNIFTSFTIKKDLTLRSNFDVSWLQTEGVTSTGEALRNTGLQYRIFGNASYNIGNGWKADTRGFFNSPRFSIQGQRPSFSIISFGLTKEIFDKKGQIGLSLVEPFSSFKDFDTELEGATFIQTSTFSIPFRSIGIRFQYKFGKLDFQAKQRRSKIKNDDLKQGGDNQGQNGN